MQINFAISCRAGCDWFVQVAGWRWHGQCQAIAGLLFALCLLLYTDTFCHFWHRPTRNILKNIFLMQTRKGMALEHRWKSGKPLCLLRSWISERNLPWYLANRSTQILRELNMSFPQGKKATEINGHLLDWSCQNLISAFSVPEVGCIVIFKISDIFKTIVNKNLHCINLHLLNTSHRKLAEQFFVDVGILRLN